MPVYRFPVLLWQDHAGLYTASVIDWHDELSAVDQSASGALSQLKAALKWIYKNESWHGPPDFVDPVLFHVPVSLRPQYEQDGRVYPCDDRVELKIPCVRGRQEGGLLICELPTLGLRFHYYDADAVRRLVTENVRSVLADKTPQELARYLFPREVRLEEVSASAPRRRHGESTGPPLPNLASIADALGQADVRRRFSRAFQRETEVQGLSERLGRQRANMLILGEQGVGKSTVVAAAARTVELKGAENEDRKSGSRHRFWLTSAGRLIAGMKYLGQWEQRCEAVIDELSSINGVLCVERMIDLVTQGGRDPTGSLASFFLPYLQNGELQMTVEATPAELTACRRLLPGFADVFQVQSLDELAGAKARAALEQFSQSFAQQLQVEVKPEVFDALVRLWRRFLPYQHLPGGPAPFLRRLISGARDAGSTEVDAEATVDAFVKQTGLPPRLLDDDEPMPVDEIKQAIGEQVIGQDDAVQAASQLVATFKAGLNDPSRPLGVLLFAGPTGVGKTETAKALSKFLFGHGQQSDRMVRLDMSEYASHWSAERLVCKPDQSPSELIERIRQQPFSVVLLDEIEKAAPPVFDVLLGLFDEGRLTDRYGRTTSLRSAIIIMTSNLGADRRRSVGFGEDDARAYEREVKSHFRPELFNRIDAVVTFSPLSRENCLKITRKELQDLAHREGIGRANLQLSFSDELVTFLTDKGFDARYGARPLQRELETRVVAPLSRYLVSRHDLKGVTVVLGLDEDGALAIRPQE